jgi:hypothetical protein
MAIALAPAQAFTLVNTAGGDGYVETLDSEYTFTLHGGGDGVRENTTQYTEIAKASRKLFFDYHYTTTDGAAVDPAGYMLNGAKVQLSSDFAASSDIQAGRIGISVVTGDVYGFYVYTTDGIAGRGVLSVLAAAVPEPSTWAMLVAGFGLVGVSIRRRRGLVLS